MRCAVSRITRQCADCNLQMPLDWNKPHCKFCGGRVKVGVSGGKPEASGVPVWDGQPDLSNWGKKKFKPAKKITGREHEELTVVSVAEVPQTKLSSLSPFMLFCGALLTLGFSSTTWLFRRLILINDSVRREECVRIGAFYVWIFSHVAALGALGWAFWECAAMYGGDAARYLRESWLLPLALVYFAIVYLMSRYYLFWVRDAIAEEAAKNESIARKSDDPSVDSYLFARGPLLLWYFGVAYLQLHVNRALKRGFLTESSFLPEEPEEEKSGETGDAPA